MGINAVYVPFRVSRGELPAFLKAFDRLPVRGYSVTIPHKEAAAALATQRDAAVEQIQAANTLLRTRERLGGVQHRCPGGARINPGQPAANTDGSPADAACPQRLDAGSGRRGQGDRPRAPQSKSA